MENQNNNSIWHKIGYRIGQIMATTVAGCFLAVLVALTIKIILFIF